MARCAVLVDAGYLFKAGGRLIADRDITRRDLILDGPAVVERLKKAARQITDRDLLRVYWYDAGSTTSHREIAELANVKLRLGHINSVGEQKGVDPLIITDMMMLARNRACDDMVLLSGDADLVVGVLQAQEHGVRVHLLGITPCRGNQALTLRQEADTCHEWSDDIVAGFLALKSESNRELQTATTPHNEKTGLLASPAASIPIASTVIVGTPAITEESLRTIAEAVASEIQTHEVDAVLLTRPKEMLPGDIDRRLLGTAKAMLKTFLHEPEKRQLRKLFREACATRNATS